MTDFLVRRDDLRVWKASDHAPPRTPAEGEVQLRVERFGLTANNITYGAFGDQLGYWQFFAAPDGWGRIPVWGFGEVVASGVQGLGAGDRFFGYFPMSSAVTLQARADPVGFVECSQARAALSATYNRYLRATPALGFLPAHDDANAIMRPLFMTGWLIADQLEQAGWYGAETVVLASASSKTAFATAFALAGSVQRPAIIGLTSAANRSFTEGLGCYDRVLAYDEVSALPIDEGIAFVDMAGSPSLRRAVHERAADALRASIVVGATHWQTASPTADDGLPGPTPEFFFAPARVDHRAGELGAAEFQQRLGAAWAGFADRVPELLEIESQRGPEALGRAYERFVDGSVDPRKGHVFSL
jgi:hypothetical protein